MEDREQVSERVHDSLDTYTSQVPSTPSSSPQNGQHGHQDSAFLRLLDRGDAVIYAIVGASFFIAALIALGYSFWSFYTSFNIALLIPDISERSIKLGQSIIQFVSDLLLVLIIMEVLGTVTHYLKSHATSLRPFLFIGIISATRGILSIGARLSVEGIGKATDPNEFNRAMIELGISAAVIVAIGITLKLLGKLADE